MQLYISLPCFWLLMRNCSYLRLKLTPANIPHSNGHFSELPQEFGLRSCMFWVHDSWVAPANQTKERPVHELFPGAFRNKSSMWIALVFPRKNTRIHKNGRNSWTFCFGPFFGLVCRGDSWTIIIHRCVDAARRLTYGVCPAKPNHSETGWSYSTKLILSQSKSKFRDEKFAYQYQVDPETFMGKKITSTNDFAYSILYFQEYHTDQGAETFEKMPPAGSGTKWAPQKFQTQFRLSLCTHSSSLESRSTIWFWPQASCVGIMFYLELGVDFVNDRGFSSASVLQGLPSRGCKILR